MAQIGNVTADQLIAGSNILSRPAEEFDNDPSVEAMWAMKAMEHAEVYFNILCSVDPKFLRLTPHDDDIYKAFRESFPDMKVDKIDEDEFKSPQEKEKWRPFCEQFKNIVEDYSFGTLLRADCKEDYSEKNSILTSRIQFYAIELARNREGFNDDVRKKFKRRYTSTFSSASWWNEECTEVVDNRKKAFTQWRKCMTYSNYLSLKSYEAVARRTLRYHKREGWKNFRDSLFPHTFPAVKANNQVEE